MGSISERLHALQEARQLEKDTLEREKQQLEKEKSRLQWEESVMLPARREQYAKFQRLQQIGLIDMIVDATDGVRINMDWPLSEEEKEEEEEEVARTVRENRDSWRHSRLVLSKDKQDEIGEFVSNFINKIKREEYWSCDGVASPIVRDDFLIETNVAFDIVKRKQPLDVWKEPLPGSQSRDIARVRVWFDGNELAISGAEETYRGVVSDADHETLEDAFVAAFDNPQSINQELATTSLRPRL